MKRIIFLAFLSASFFSFSQDLDSIRKVISKTSNDTIRVNLLFDLGNSEPILRISFWDSIKTHCLSKSESFKKEDKQYSFYKAKTADALNNIGYLYSNNSNVKRAMQCYDSAFSIYTGLKDQSGFASLCNNMGLEYENNGNVPKALEFYHKSLNLHEKIKGSNGEVIDKSGLAYVLNNIGAVHAGQEDYKEALAYFERCRKLREEIKDTIGLGETLNNFGFVYSNMGKPKDALTFYLKAMKFYELAGELNGAALTYNNIGHLYYVNGKSLLDGAADQIVEKSNELALEYYQKSISSYLAAANENGTVPVYANIAAVKLRQGKLAEAKLNGEKGLVLARALGYPNYINYCSKTLAPIYAGLGDYKKAYEMQVLFKQMSDSITNESNKKLSIQKSFQYEYDKKAAADSVKVAEERKLVDIRFKQERFKRSALYVGLALVFVFSIFMYNRFRVTRKQKRVIEEQKKEVDKQKELADSRRIIAEEQRHIIAEKQKEILDSIHYAKRIQEALLTGEAYIREHLQAESFILYKPKDIVSGDFYWAVSHLDKFYIATADCTGHGVPGAFMSLLNINFLNENLIERNIVKPGNILSEQRKEIIRALNPKGDENSKDGMDCVLCSFDMKNKTLEFAAANNPLWLLRNGSMIEFKADKMPVGKGEDDAPDFTNQRVELQAGDLVYTFTDGYADQFGGPKGKKFKYKQLEEILIANHTKSMEMQKKILADTIADWMGNQEQVDDILIIGVRVGAN